MYFLQVMLFINRLNPATCKLGKGRHKLKGSKASELALSSRHGSPRSLAMGCGS